MNTWSIALRQIRRYPFRSLLVATAVAAASAAAITVIMIVVGVNAGLNRTANRLGADLMVIPRGERTALEFNEALLTGKPASFYMAPGTVEVVSRIPGVDHLSPQTFAQTLTNASCCAGHFFVVGFDPKTDFTITPWLKRDAPVLTDTGSDEAVVGDRILLRLGQTVSLYGKRFTVAGVLEPTGTGMDWTVYVTEVGLREMASKSLADAERPLGLSQGAVSAAFVRAGHGEDLIDLAERIEQAIPEVQVVLSSSVAAIARGQMGTISIALLCAAGAIWLMATVLSSVVFSQVVRERAGEIALLIAKGASGRFILRMLAQESVIVALTSALTGSLIGVTAIAVSHESLAEVLGVVDVLPSPLMMIVLLLGIGGLTTSSSVGAALIPAACFLRSEPYEAIKRGGT